MPEIKAAAGDHLVNRHFRAIPTMDGDVAAIEENAGVAVIDADAECYLLGSGHSVSPNDPMPNKLRHPKPTQTRAMPLGITLVRTQGAQRCVASAELLQ